MVNKILFFIFFIFFIACNRQNKIIDSKPKWLLHEDTLVNMIVDIRIVDAASYSNEGGKSRNKVKDLEFVYKKYNTSDSVFKKSHDYFTRHPKKLLKIYEKAINKLSTMQAEYYENN